MTHPFDPASWAKLDPNLQRALAGGGQDERPALITLAGEGEGSPAAFAREARPLIEQARTLGAGQVIELWLARSVSTRLRPAALAQLARRDDVARLTLDAPQRALPEPN